MPTRRKRAGAAPKHKYSILVLQGDGALSAYQADVYQGMVEQKFAPGVGRRRLDSAINPALIGGNLPARRIQRRR